MNLHSPVQHIEHWPIDRLVFYSKNPRKNDAAIDRMMASIGMRLQRSAWSSCRADVRVVAGTRSLVAAAARSSLTMTGTTRSGYAWADVRRQEDVHHSAGLVATVCPLQLLLSSVGLGVERQLGAITPHCKDPSRLPDPATLRRWACGKLISLWFWVKAGLAALASAALFTAPTILAWDCAAAGRILHLEASSP